MDAYLYFHSALVAEASELVSTLAVPLGDESELLDRVADRFAFFQQVNTVHEAAEEAFLFPAIEERVPIATDAVAF